MHVSRWQSYHTVWTMLFLGWVVSYIDRALTGPVITWMKDHDASFLQGVTNPHAFGGLIGSLFFAGYMLTQFPGGYFGDRYGHRNVVLISIFWAGVTTLCTGLVGGLIWFVALRILTGLGEGAFYSNDRTLVAKVTPPEKLGFGMGLVITGLTTGLTIAFLVAPPLINWAVSFMKEEAWRMPFVIMSIPTFLVWAMMTRYLPAPATSQARISVAVRGLLGYSAVFFAVIMAIYILATRSGWSETMTSLALAGLACLLVFYIFRRKKEEMRPVLMSRNLVLIYLSAIPVLWHLWLYGFWSVDIIKSSGSSFMAAALVASFNGLAGLIGFPLGGLLSDRALRRGGSRKGVLLTLTAIEGLTIFVFGGYLWLGHGDKIVMAILLFTSGLFFFALQPVSHAFTADLAPETHRGAAFGMWNLIAEIGALLSPVLSGVIRDATGHWWEAILLDSALMMLSCVLVFGIRPGPLH